MTGPHSETEDGATRQISVAELLARNGNIGAPAPTRRRRRRRGDSDAVTVAELTGEIPVIRDEPRETRTAPPAPEASEPGNGRVAVAEPAPQPAPEPVLDEPVGQAPETVSDDVAEAVPDQPAKSAYWSEPEPRWPKSDPVTRRGTGPERSEYPRPLRYSDDADADRRGQSGAEDMSPDPVEHYGDTSVDTSVDLADGDVPATTAEETAEDSAYVRSYLHGSEGTLFGGQSLADEVARRRSEQAPSVFDEEEDRDQEEAEHTGQTTGTLTALWRGAVIVLQSILAVAFGAGLFIAFDQLWRWNSIVALVLSVLVILGLVVGVRVVRKTEDIASTLIAVAVGALITLGPLALLQSG
ncbi:hypothetical protein [Mycobacterium sp. 1423905.2]|uniref:hypothetical protein n=1 Tax=Mycobacterium sp. 1423905.2 TaxID=1856859 RepID=UPI0007FC5E5E|nr:hypothetical protein [Mycobacterium sp. 1423905.2]OBJ48192.1 hypothetical protein A9W95_05005 [Mycobacterium sp. 1423905.2]